MTGFLKNIFAKKRNTRKTEMKESKKKVTVFFSCDDGYAPFLSVSAGSLISNRDRSREYEIIVLHDGMSAENIEKITALSCEGVSVVFVDMGDRFRRFAGRLGLRDYYSHSIYFRLFIPDLFPELERALYLDADTVILSDVGELFDTELGEGQILGAVRDAVVPENPVFMKYVEGAVGVPTEKYFNSGVLVMDLCAMRRERVLETFLSYASENGFTLLAPDQDYLNYICRGRVRYLGTEWNTMTMDPHPSESPALIHYNMFAKPWHYDDVPFGGHFWEYAGKSVYYDAILAEFRSYGEDKKASDLAAEKRMEDIALGILEGDNFMNTVEVRRKAEEKELSCLTISPDRAAVLRRIRQNERLGGDFFFRDVEDDPPSRTLLPDDVDYLHETVRFKVNGGLTRVVENTAKFVFRRKLRMSVIGEENLKGINGGAIFTANHFAVTDNLAIKNAADSVPGKHRMYKLVKEGNYFMPGVIGWLLKYCDTLPLSGSVHTMKKLDEAISRILKNGDFILIYPEQAMWWNYRKPRPYKIGAFWYAAKNGVPVVPCFTAILPKTGDNIFEPDNIRYETHIMKPIYPDPALKISERATAMMEENYRVCCEEYEKIYGEELVYGEA